MIPTAAIFTYRAWRYRWLIERAELALLSRLLQPGQSAIDAGAHKGTFTYWMRRAVGPSGRVFAFEPQAELAREIEAQVRSLGWDNVVVEPKALSSGCDPATLFVPPGPRPSPSATLDPEGGEPVAKVERCTLDDRFADRPSPIALIKCDVEGHELEVFRGGGEILRRDRPALIFECEARRHPPGALGEVFGHLEDLGYRGGFFWRGRVRPLSELDLAQHQVPGRRPYANNFVFR